jgi:hypothetical protein
MRGPQPSPAEPRQGWRAVLSNHREAIAAMVVFALPTLTFGVACGFFIIARHCRKARCGALQVLPFEATNLGHPPFNQFCGLRHPAQRKRYEENLCLLLNHALPPMETALAACVSRFSAERVK